jgi:hypothetical protein
MGVIELSLFAQKNYKYGTQMICSRMRILILTNFTRLFVKPKLFYYYFLKEAKKTRKC